MRSGLLPAPMGEIDMRLFSRVAMAAALLSPLFLLGGCSIINRLI